MQQQTNGPEDRTARPAWFGYAQLGIILILIVTALYFARAPGRVILDTSAGEDVVASKPVVNVIWPASTGQALTVKLTGAVRAYDQVAVRSEVVGRVAWVSPEFANGGSIVANETFVRIEPARYELKVEAAEMAVKEAEARLSAQNTGSVEARLGAARAELKLAQLDLERTEISLPYNARVVSSSVSVGELVGPVEGVDARASVLGMVYQPEMLQVDAPVDPKVLQYLTPATGRTASIHTRTEEYAARVERVSSVVAPQTRLASLFLKFVQDRPLESLPLPGTFVEVEIQGPEYQDVYVLPDAVLQPGDSVWTVRDGVLRSISVQALGHSAAGMVVEAFDAGEGVVTGTLPGAAEGLAVLVAEAEAAQ